MMLAAKKIPFVRATTWPHTSVMAGWYLNVTNSVFNPCEILFITLFTVSLVIQRDKEKIFVEQHAVFVSTNRCSRANEDRAVSATILLYMHTHTMSIQRNHPIW